MITNQDRSKWFGASDTSTIMGNWETETFGLWWLTKLGIVQTHYDNIFMRTGNLMEIPIIRAIEKSEGRKIKLGKRPVYVRRYRLRANYDGLCDTVVEIKTTKKMFKTVPKGYWQQCQVLMYATGRKKAELYAYELTGFDYDAPYFPEIDLNRLKRFEIEYDKEFIRREYLPRLKVLAKALRHGRFPDIKAVV